MFNFFKKSLPSKETATKVELISIHIPKTAGTSFRNTLKKVYGEKEVIRLDINLGGQKVKINNQQYSLDHLPIGTKVIHGHFSPVHLRQSFELEENIPMITWLRHPVHRVISNYYYLEKRLKEELQEESKGLNILRKMQRSLLEYAQNEINRNRQHKFLEGVKIEELAFVGIQEHYSRDLKILASQFGWKDTKELKHNITGRDISKIDEGVLDKIAELNELDMALYNKAIQLRQT